MATETSRGSRKTERLGRNIGPREHYIGVGILSFVMLLCAWMLIYGLAPKGLLWGHYDPALFAGQTSSVAAPAQPAAPAESAAAQPDLGGEGEAPSAAPGAAAAAEGGEGGEAPAGGGARPAPKFLPLDGGGWTAGKVETFSQDNLYEKIDGRAEAYLAYGVVGMECLSFAEPKPAGGAEAGSVEVYVYDQGTPLQAFGMYGSERTGDEKPLQLGQEGHDSEGSLYFWRDRYYCQVQPSSNAQPAVEQAAELAAQLNDKLPRTEFQVPGLTWFPKQGLKPGTITYVLKEGLGQDWFDDLYTAKYDVGGVEVQAFVARRDTEAKAAELLAKYQAFLKSSKAKVSQVKLSGVSMTEMDDKGMVDIVFRRGTTFAGVSYVEGKRPAETIAARLAAQ